MKRVAFIKDGIVISVMNCDQKLFDILMSDNIKIDVSQADQHLTTNWTYDGTNFSAPESIGEPWL